MLQVLCTCWARQDIHKRIVQLLLPPIGHSLTLYVNTAEAPAQVE